MKTFSHVRRISYGTTAKIQRCIESNTTKYAKSSQVPYSKYSHRGQSHRVLREIEHTHTDIYIYIYIYIYIGMALFVRGHRWPPNPPVAPQSTGGPLKNRWPLQILAHSFGRILRHLYFTNIWNKSTLTTVYTHTETFMGTSHSLNVYRRKDHSMKDIFHKNGSLF